MKTVLFNLSKQQLIDFVIKMGQPKFRAAQISEWIERGAPDFSVMKNLPRDLQNDLDKIALTLPVKIKTQLNSSDKQTTKFLLELMDGEVIESVLMQTTYGNSVCVSSQAGCAMGCRFCASTLLGLKRNLTADEMYAQVLVAGWALREKMIQKERRPNGDPNNSEVSHIVVMGTGEPLDNTDNLIDFLQRAHTDLGIGWRKISISTCGIVPGIRQITAWGKPVNLAVSLHAPNNRIREEIMPINNRYPIGDVLNAAFECSDNNNRQLMIEYILLAHPIVDGESFLYNSGSDAAEELSDLLRGKNCMVNLIPWNAVDERQFAAPSGNALHRFQDILIKNGIHTRVRRTRGMDIGGACGQLRLNNAKTGENSIDTNAPEWS